VRAWCWRAVLLLTAGGVFAQATPMSHMVGEGVISTDLNEFGGALSPDGHEIYFSISVPRSYLYALCVSRRVNGRWSQPTVVPFSGTARDFDAVLSPDGRRMFFVSDRGDKGVTADKPDVDLWTTERVARGAWGRPRRLPSPINRADREWFATEAIDGTLYYAASRPNGVDLFRAARAADGYAEPQPIGLPVDTSGLDGEPLVAPDQSFLLFSAYERPGGSGDWDLYISHRAADGWGEPRNLGPLVNSGARDYSPRLGPDGRTLIFTSERHIGMDLRTLPFRYADLTAALRGTLNGNGNLYSVDLRSLGMLPAGRPFPRD
jgi:hypothetical protein